MSDLMAIKSKIRDYNVHFVEDFTLSLRNLIEQESFFIIDSIVYGIQKEKIDQLIIPEKRLIIEAHERNKTVDKCLEIIEILVEKNFRRNRPITALGGGVIQDITAFTASILYRGVDWTFIPTTLLAQADSCIGGKTSINLNQRKNLVGSFFPPSNIYIDTGFLESLTEEDIFSGIGEMLHFYFYSGSTLFERLISEKAEVLHNRYLLKRYIAKSLQIKKQVIEIDEFDKGERNKFNYGHTFGHALESLSGYKIKHGQAVTVGMDIANYLSLSLGSMNQEIFDKTHILLVKNFPDYRWGQFDIEQYVQYLAKDKKNIGNDLTCILAEGPGRLFKKRIPMNESFKEIIQEYFLSIIPVT